MTEHPVLVLLASAAAVAVAVVVVRRLCIILAPWFLEGPGFDGPQEPRKWRDPDDEVTIDRELRVAGERPSYVTPPPSSTRRLLDSAGERLDRVAASIERDGAL